MLPCTNPVQDALAAATSTHKNTVGVHRRSKSGGLSAGAWVQSTCGAVAFSSGSSTSIASTSSTIASRHRRSYVLHSQALAYVALYSKIVAWLNRSTSACSCVRGTHWLDMTAELSRDSRSGCLTHCSRRTSRNHWPSSCTTKRDLVLSQIRHWMPTPAQEQLQRKCHSYACSSRNLAQQLLAL